MPTAHSLRVSADAIVTVAATPPLNEPTKSTNVSFDFDSASAELINKQTESTNASSDLDFASAKLTNE